MSVGGGGPGIKGGNYLDISGQPIGFNYGKTLILKFCNNIIIIRL